MNTAFNVTWSRFTISTFTPAVRNIQFKLFVLLFIFICVGSEMQQPICRGK